MIELNDVNVEDTNEDVRHFGKRGHLNYGKAGRYNFEGYNRNKYHSMIRCMCGNIFSAHSHDMSKIKDVRGDELKKANYPLVCPECGTIIEKDKTVDLTLTGRSLYNSSHVRFIDDENIYTISTVLLDADNTMLEPYPVISNKYAVRLKFRFDKRNRTALMYVSKFLCEDQHWDEMKLIARFINFTQPIKCAENYFKIDTRYIRLVVPMEIREEFREFVEADWPLEALSGFEDLAWANRLPNYEEAKLHRKCFKNLGNQLRFEDVNHARNALREDTYINEWQKKNDERTIKMFKAYNRYKRFFRTGHMVKDFKTKTLKALLLVESLLKPEDIHPELVDLFLIKNQLATIKNYSIIEGLFDNLEKKKEVLIKCRNVGHGKDGIYNKDLSLIKNTFNLNEISITDVLKNGKVFPKNIITMLETLRVTAEKIKFLAKHDIVIDTNKPFREIYALVNTKYHRVSIPEDIELLGDDYCCEDFDLGDNFIFKVITNTNEIRDIIGMDFMENSCLKWEKYAYSRYSNHRRGKNVLIAIEKDSEIVGCFDVMVSTSVFSLDEYGNKICKMKYINELWLKEDRTLDKVILFSTSLGLTMTSKFYKKINLKNRVEFHETYKYNLKHNFLIDSTLPELSVSTTYFKYLIFKQEICFETPFFDETNMPLTMIENDGIMYRSAGEIFITRGVKTYAKLIDLLIEHKIYIPDIHNKPSSFYTIEKNGHVIAVFNMKKCNENDEDRDIDILTHGYSLKRGKGIQVSHKPENNEILSNPIRLRDVYDDFLLKLAENESFKVPMYEDVPEITSDDYSVVDEDDLMPF